jgi:hypothetical protein
MQSFVELVVFVVGLTAIIIGALLTWTNRPEHTTGSRCYGCALCSPSVSNGCFYDGVNRVEAPLCYSCMDLFEAIPLASLERDVLYTK